MNAEVQNFGVSFDGYMYIEKSVVDLFWIKLIVLCSTVHMDLCTQVLDFCECRSTKFLCKFDGYMHIEESVVDVFWIKLIVLCSPVHMDLCTQVLDFCECRSTKFRCKF